MDQKSLQEEINYVKDQIIQKYQPEKIILFGSATSGNFTSDSDIDFLIIKKNTPYYGPDRIRELDHIIDYNVAVDFLVYKPEEYDERLKLGDPFIKQISETGKIIYG